VEWVTLTDEQRGQLVSLWLLAADRDGSIPADPKILQKLCQFTKKPDLEVFINHGFIEENDIVTPERRQDDANMTAQTRLDKTRLDKTREDSKQTLNAARFAPPSLREIKDYVIEMDYNNFNAVEFFNFYESKGWMVGKNKMKDWKAATRTWQHRGKN
jgi:hypothetical protein